jgi:outer membrane protein
MTDTRPRGKRAILALAALMPVAAAAQSAPPLWEAGIAAGWGSSPAYPGSEHRVSRAVAAPWLVYRGPLFRIEDNNIGARLLKTPRVELDVGIGGALPASSRDVQLRAGMPDLGTLIELGPRLKVRLNDPEASDQWRLDLPLRAVIEFQGGAQGRGTIIEPEIKWGRRIAPGWDVSASVGALWASRRLNSHLYSVAPAYATASRPAYQAQAGSLGSRLGLGVRYQINPDLWLRAGLRLDHYGNHANRASPLFESRTGVSVGIGLSWTFARSGRAGER